MAQIPATPSIVQRLATGRHARSHSRQRAKEAVIKSGLIGSSIFSILVTATIILVLGGETWRFFQSEDVSLREFLFSTQWNPLLGAQKHFGIWSLVYGTLLVTGVAMLMALPLGLVTAIYLSEYAHPRTRSLLKPTLEILAGIPTVVYGFFALTFITPYLLKNISEGFNVYNAMSAGIAVGILTLPIVSSLCEDALRAVPQSLRDGAMGLGATKFDVSVKVVTPAALSGIISAFLLAIARAVGETMVVALAAGNTPKFLFNDTPHGTQWHGPNEEVQTMTAYMVQMALGDVSNFGVEYFSMYAVAATLFVLTMVLTVLGQLIRRRYREVYR